MEDGLLAMMDLKKLHYNNNHQDRQLTNSFITIFTIMIK